MRDRARWPRDRARSHPGRRPAARRGRCDRARDRVAEGRHGVRHARAVLASGQVAALCRCVDRRGRGQGRVGDGGSLSEGERPRPCQAQGCRHRGRGRRRREGSRGDQCGLPAAREGRPAAVPSQDRLVARRPYRDGIGREQVDHGTRGARRRPSPARDARRHSGRSQHGRRRRSGPDLPPAGSRSLFAGPHRRRFEGSSVACLEAGSARRARRRCGSSAAAGIGRRPAKRLQARGRGRDHRRLPSRKAAST